MVRRHNNCHTWHKRRTHQKIGIDTRKIRKRMLQSKQEKKSKFYLKETEWLGHNIAQD